MKVKPVFSSAQLVFTFILLFFFFTMLNGYVLNLVSDYRANEWLVLAGVIIEMAAIILLAHRFIAVAIDWLELVGLSVVILGVWVYFILPALPTWLPPTQSSDAVRVYLQVMFTFPAGTLVSWYPAGGTFLTAMLAHWLGIEPLRLLHPVAASFVALSAGAVYGITGALLPRQPSSKILALIAPALLFVPWSYFAGTLNWEQYFFAQVFAQYFILAAVWYSARYAEEPHWIFAVLIGVTLLGVVAAYPIFVAIPFGLFGLIVLVRLAQQKNLRANRGLLFTLGVFSALLILAAIALQRGGILELLAGKLSAEGEVGVGGVAQPSLATLGGPVFLALVIIGILFAWRAGAFGKTILGLVGIWLVQLLALLAVRQLAPVSDYRVAKTFYLLVFPFAICAALPIAQFFARAKLSPRTTPLALIASILLLSAFIAVWRPPKSFSPLTESEIEVAQWAKKFYNETYQIAYLDDSPISAYWLAFGIWRETLPNEWFQWIPAGRKLGPASFEEWLTDPGWHERLLVRYLDQVPVKVRVVYQAGDAAIIDKETPPDYGPQPPHRSDLIFGSSITLIGYDLPRTTVQPGETLTLTTWVQSLYPPPATVGWHLDLIDHTGRVMSRVERAPFDDKYPVQRWAPGKYAREVWSLPVPSNLQPGAYDLRITMFQRTTGDFVDVRPVYSTKLSDHMVSAPITRIKIPVASPSADELKNAVPLNAPVGDAFALASYRLQSDPVSRRVHVTLYWQALTPVDQNYTAFVHVLDATGQVVAQSDREPRDGAYPTSIWTAGEIIPDVYTLDIPADARAPFTLEIGMYTQPSLQRLPIGNADHLEFQISDF